VPHFSTRVAKVDWRGDRRRIPGNSEANIRIIGEKENALFLQKTAHFISSPPPKGSYVTAPTILNVLREPRVAQLALVDQSTQPYTTPSQSPLTAANPGKIVSSLFAPR
jgi:hypothetical protein